MKRYVYFWADGIHLEARLEDQAQCILVIIGATPEGRKETGRLYRWHARERTIVARSAARSQRRGLAASAGTCRRRWRARLLEALGESVADDNASMLELGNKTANVLNKLPKNLHTKAKRALQEIWMAETKKDAVMALDAFVESYGPKYDKAVDCLTKG